jgi:hypothetical protein
MRPNSTPLCLLALGLACGNPSTTTVGLSDGATTHAGSTGGSTGAPTTGAPTSTSGASTGSGDPTTGGTTDATTGGSTGASATTSTTEATTTSTTSGDSSGSGGSTIADTTTGDLNCEAPGILNVCDQGNDKDPFHALGVGCPGAIENTIPITDTSFNSQPIAWRTATGFGTAKDPNDPAKLLFRPREGAKFLVVSTGRVANLQPDGSLVEANPQYNNDNNFNPDTPNELPAPMSPLVGSNGGQGGSPFKGCDGVHDCSDSIEPNWTLGNGDPNDLLWGAFTVTVPAGVESFLFDAAFFSSEYPEYVGQKFNDMFIGWSTSEAYTGNVTFFEGQPFTVTSLAQAMENSGYTGDAPELAGTGFTGHGTTGWVTVQAPVTPGETFTFAFAIMDMGDSSKATVTLVDHWRWDCKGCVPIEVDPKCGTPNHAKCCGLCVDKADDPMCGTNGHPMCCVGA